jgi:hypothetical protein
LCGIRTFFSLEVRPQKVTLLARGVAKALFHDISLPSSSKGSRLSGIAPPPICKGGMGLNLNRIDTDNIAHPRTTSLYKNERKGTKGGNKKHSE